MSDDLRLSYLLKILNKRIEKTQDQTVKTTLQELKDCLLNDNTLKLAYIDTIMEERK